MKCQAKANLVAVKNCKTDCNTLFSGRKNLPSLRVFLIEIWGYAGLKDRHGITEQWFCLQMPGKGNARF